MKNIFGLIITALGAVEILLSLVILPFCVNSEKYMACSSSSHIDVVLGIAVIAVGITLWKKANEQPLLSYAATLLGLAIALVPNLIVGVCENAQMHCHTVAAPVLAAAGILIALAGFASGNVTHQKNEFEEKWGWL